VVFPGTAGAERIFWEAVRGKKQTRGTGTKKLGWSIKGKKGGAEEGFRWGRRVVEGSGGRGGRGGQTGGKRRGEHGFFRRLLPRKRDAVLGWGDKTRRDGGH